MTVIENVVVIALAIVCAYCVVLLVKSGMKMYKNKKKSVNNTEQMKLAEIKGIVSMCQSNTDRSLNKINLLNKKVDDLHEIMCKNTQTYNENLEKILIKLNENADGVYISRNFVNQIIYDFYGKTPRELIGELVEESDNKEIKEIKKEVKEVLEKESGNEKSE